MLAHMRDRDPAQLLQVDGPWWNLERVKTEDPHEELGRPNGNRREGIATRTQRTGEPEPSSQADHVYFLIDVPRGCVHHASGFVWFGFE